MRFLGRSDFLKNFDEVLKQVQFEFSSEAERPSSEIYSLIIELSESQYAKSKNLFVEMIEDSRSSWVKIGLSALLDFSGQIDTEIIEKVRKILLNSENPYVRMTAASSLGQISKWPDPALRQCLMHEKDRDVRISAARAILTLAKVNIFATDMEIDRMKAGEIEPEFAEIQRITQTDADGGYEHITEPV
jgi:HEAT repeats